MLDALHEPILPLLARLLAELRGDPARVLDLGCGEGAKLGLLRARWPRASFVGLDRERALLRAAGDAGYEALLVGDAHQLPLAEASVDLAWCCATLGLLASPRLALRELGGVLRPDGRLLLITATRRWVLPIAWPVELRRTLLAARPAPWAAAICDREIGREAEELLAQAGLSAGITRAWPLEGELAEDELALLDWGRFEALAGPQLSAEQRACCTWLAAASEPVVVSLLVATLGTKETSGLKLADEEGADGRADHTGGAAGGDHERAGQDRGRDGGRVRQGPPA
jgi:SAM-dependent methyltransferase